MILKKHKAFYIIGLISWFIAILFILLVPEQKDFKLLSIGFPIAIATYLFFIWSKPSGKKLYWLILAGIGARVFAIFCFPQLSDDIYRFIWDGRITHNGMQPYAHLPIDIVKQLPSLADGNILSKMNSPEYFTVYPPVSQLVFYLSSWLGISVGFSSVLMKIIFYMAELATLVFSLRILKELKLQIHNILIYWLNPLIIIEGIGNLHFEIVLIAFLAGALYYWKLDKHYQSITFLALSVGAKLLSILLLPYLFWQIRWKLGFKVLLVFVIVSLLIFSPLLLGLNYGEFLSSIDLYFRKFEFNAGIYYVLRWLGFQFSGYNLIAYLGPILGLSFIAITIWLTVKEKIKDPISYLYIVMLIYLFSATTVHPWYLSIPLFCSIFIRSKVALVWSCLIWLTYINYSSDVYTENLWVVAIEYLLVFGYIFYEIYNNRGQFSNAVS